MLLVNQTVRFRFSIHDSSANGVVCYRETQTTTSNTQGLVYLYVGKGTPESNAFNLIRWEVNAKFLQVELDLLNGNNFTDLGTTALMSVPYALYAKRSGSVENDSISIQTLQPDSISYRSVRLTGNFSTSNNIGISGFGFCVGANPNPGFSGNYYYATIGSGQQFMKMLDNLLPGTTYHVRAFIISNGTKWGQDLTFTTKSLRSPQVLTKDPVANSTNSLFCSATIQDDGGSVVLEKGFCYSTISNPTTTNSTVMSSGTTNDFSATINNLQSNTTYYIRAFARNNTGIGYGNQIVINSSSNYLPAITTLPYSGLSYTSVISGGSIQSNILNLAITSKGLCWNTSPNPTVANNILTVGNNSSADYNLTINNLQPNTTYYMKAYYQSGTDYIYGNEISFTTRSRTLATLRTLDISMINPTSANLGGNILDDGGSNIIAKGICWGIAPNPGLNDSVILGSGAGNNFFVTVSGLSPVTRYYVRSFATNSSGTGFGNEVTFKPSEVPVLNGSLPIVGTKPIVVLGANYVGGGYVSSSGSGTLLSRGICFSTTNSNPTLSDSVITFANGLGDFDIALANISGCGANIYYRAFATNTYGTSYGNVLNINTGWPLVSPVTIQSLNYPNVSLSANVSSDCGITQKGFVWSIKPNPVVNGTDQFMGRFTQAGSGVGNYSSVMPQMVPNVTYHVRAYAQNSIGIIYGKDTTITINSYSNGHFIGEQFAGGIVFYIDGSGQHGLVAADINTGPAWSPGWESFEAVFGGDRTIWGCSGSLMNTQSSIGSGAQNTANIVAGCYAEPTAAKFCDQFVHNGFGDWYLPSKDELSLLFNNLHINGLGQFRTDPWGGFRFWSSTDYDNNNAWAIEMSNGGLFPGLKSSNYYMFTRAIRSF